MLILANGCASSEKIAANAPPSVNAEAVKEDTPMPYYEAALGPYEREVSTSSEMAQAYMKQGFQMMYAFAKGEAPQSFVEAQRHDPACAMCFWGEAWSHGPYLNGRMDAGDAPVAFAAIQKARRLAEKRATDVERALIDAMTVRFEEVHEIDDRAHLDTLYANAMADVYARFPKDLDVGTLYAESLMLLEPRRGRWDASDPDVLKIHSILEAVLTRDIKHPGACHLYIHATESTTRPEKAEACAEHLGQAIPGASHINHMPSHTFNRVGRWGESVKANIQAWHSDLKAGIGEGFAIYPSHNLHMLLFAASMDGQGAVAIQAGKDYSKIIDGGIFYQVLAMVRFGRFDEIIELPAAYAPSRPIFRGFWNFGKGYAHLKQGRVEKAKSYLNLVKQSALEYGDGKKFRGHAARQLLGVVGGILEAEILYEDGQVNAAIEALEAAIELEDGLQYDEPEPLNFSARHWLGAILLKAGKPEQAESVYRAALEDHPNNGWCLLGLSEALEAQGELAEAREVHAAFEKAWARSDTWIRASRF